MVSLIKVLAGLFAVASYSVLFCESVSIGDLEKIDENLVAALDSISNYLDEAVSDSDFGENLQAVKDLLAEETEKANIVDKVYIDTLKELVLASNGCSDEIHRSLKKINNALDGQARKSNRPTRRIIAFVHDLSVKHAKDCLDSYKNIFESMESKLDPAQVEFVETFSKRMEDYDTFWYFHPSDWRKNFNSETQTELLHGPPISWKEYKYYAFEVIEGNANGNDDSKSLQKALNEVDGVKHVDERGLKRLFNKYLVEPCKYYLDEVGPTVFEPVTYNALWYQEDAISAEKPKFYRGWARYVVCHQFMVNKAEVFQSVLEVAKSDFKSPIKYFQNQ